MENKMLTIADYKKKYIDRQGRAPAMLLNDAGETLLLGDVHTVTNTNGRLKMKWRATDVPSDWLTFTHIALLGNGRVEYISEITPTHFEGKPRNVEVTFYE
jgi:hypothetical protein